jgi:hypothetical protein
VRDVFLVREDGGRCEVAGIWVGKAGIEVRCVGEVFTDEAQCAVGFCVVLKSPVCLKIVA